MTPSFVHLRVHTAYSLLEGAIKVPELVRLCQENQMPAVAVTDTANLFGGMDVSSSCAQSGIQPIIGTQLLVQTQEKDIRQTSLKEEINPTFDKMVVLVQNATGYHNLLELFDRYYRASVGQPHITLSDLQACNEGLILLTGGVEGPLGRLILSNKPADDLLLQLKESFKDRLYMEIQRHGTSAERQTEPVFIDLAYRYEVPLVATNDVMFATPDMYEAHDALICIAEKTVVDVVDRRKVTPQHYFKSAQEMQELFADLPEAIQNTVAIAQRCGFMVEKRKIDFPYYDCGKYTAEELLALKAEEGLKMRLKDRPDDWEKYHERLNYELGIINQMGFPSYFLIVSDFIQWSKAHGIPVGPGRGSGVSSVVAWALTITDLDPLKFNLLFERFLNPERVSMPDFDVDFCQERRGESIHYVQEKYGFDHVAQIITFGQLQAKAVLRDVGRVFQLPYPAVNRLCKLVPNGLDEKGKPYTLKGVIETEPAFQAEADQDPKVKRVLEIALQLEGLYRNASTHAAGVVIGRYPLKETIPIYKDPSSDMPVTQFNMKFVENAGLIKFDFLGLKTLTVLAKTQELLKRRGVQVDLANVPLNDKETFKLLCRADTAGVFQFESAGMRKVLRDMQPDKIEDLVALVALYRPGPMGNIPSYIARKHGEEEIDYLHPMLESILKETYGIIIYQEQVMQIAQAMAGYSLGGADLLRRAMGKKKIEEMHKQRKIFLKGATERNVSESKANEVFDLMERFANYGFNKSHAVAYAFISYQTAYLKAHYPVEFMAATMTLDKGDTDKLGFFKRELNHMNIALLPVDVNKSEVDFSVENGAIRYALSAVKNVGESAMKSLVNARTTPFLDILDFLSRVDTTIINKRALENLVKSGALDSLHRNRRQLFDQLDKLLLWSNRMTEEKHSAQISLFGNQPETQTFTFPNVPDWGFMDKITKEAEALGFYLSAHPLDKYVDSFEKLRLNLYSEVGPILQQCGGGTVHLRMTGIVHNAKERTGKFGKFTILTVSDPSNTFEILAYEEATRKYRDLFKTGSCLLFSVAASLREDEVRLSLQNVHPLTEAILKVTQRLVISFKSDQCLPIIQKLLSTAPEGHTKVVLAPQLDKGHVEYALPKAYQITTATLEALQQIPGVTSVKQD